MMIIEKIKILSYLKIFHLCKRISSDYILQSHWNNKFGLFNLSVRAFCLESNEVPIEHVRNFSIIAHIDHGKSTLADRLLEITGAISKGKENKQVLDRLPVERQRGITVKAVSASLRYKLNDINYELNLIDTPGHVDFSNEVSRSLLACQGVILLVDSNKGVQAQTLSNYYLAVSKNLTIIPVLNKIDLPKADPDAVAEDLKSIFDIEPSTVKRISAKTGLGVEELLEVVINKIPYPKVNRDKPFKALIIDSWYDNYRGSILFIYVQSGKVEVGNQITCYKTGKSFTVKNLGKLCPEERSIRVLFAGEVGIINCFMKDLRDANVGDTVFAAGIDIGPVEEIKTPKPVVFTGLYPAVEMEQGDLKSALNKLLLNDPSVTVEKDNSMALGSGWRLGFLGCLHLDVFRQRLQQEFDKEVVLTPPSVTYKFKLTGEKIIKKNRGDELTLSNPCNFPDRSVVSEMYEPLVTATIITPIEYYDIILKECSLRRGKEVNSTVLGQSRILLKFTLPLNEIIIDFHDRLKNITSGYASLDYEDAGYVPSSLAKLEILLNGKEVEELTHIIHESQKRTLSKKLVTKLTELVPRQQVAVVIRAVVNGKIMASETIKPYRKNVLFKLHGGGDPSRKMKLLKAQSEGKKLMRKIANIEVNRDIFVKVLRSD